MAVTGTILSGLVDPNGNVKLVVDYSDGTSHISVDVNVSLPTDVPALAKAIINEGANWHEPLKRATLAAAITSNGTVNPIEPFIGAAVEVPEAVAVSADSGVVVP